MEIPRVYADSDGRSRIDSARIDLLEDEPGQLEGRRFEWSDPSKPIPFSDPWTAKQVNFWRYPVGHSAGWHNPPERVCLVILSGAAEVGVSTGEAFVMGVGDMALFEDTSGEGHRFGSADGQEVVGLVLSVTDDSPHAPR